MGPREDFKNQLGCFQPAVQVAVVMPWKLLNISRSRAPWQPRRSKHLLALPAESEYQLRRDAAWLSRFLFPHLQAGKLQCELDEGDDSE